MSTAQLIVIVEDDLLVRESTARLLESHGYATASFASAEAFLQSEQLARTHCLISDVRMPGLSGTELQRLLIEAGRRIPTILVTAYLEPHTRAAALSDGAVCYLAKPVSEDCLLTWIHSALQECALSGGDQ